MELQKTMDSQRTTEQNQQSGRIAIPDFKIYRKLPLQSYINKNTVLARKGTPTCVDETKQN